MSNLLGILNQRDAFLAALQDKIREADESSTETNNAATVIQRCFRGYKARFNISFQSTAVNQVQRSFRGHLGRLSSQMARKKRNEERLLSMFHYFCLQVQRCFRGYYSRRYKHNFYSRKNYIKQVEEKGNEIRAAISKYSHDQLLREDQESRKQADDDFRTNAQNLHHLMSTKRIRGVFNPPEEFMNVPTLHDIPVEEHIRGVVRDLLRTKGIAKVGLVPDIRGTKKIPLKGLKNRLSVQASAPYDTVKIDKQQTKLLHRLLTAGKGNFFTGGKTHLIDNKEDPLCKGDPFCDAWANPLMQRGVPASQEQLKESAYIRKALFVYPPEKPYYTRTDGNKSTALPNDLFDVIAEAEETGGAVQRYMGTSARFGLPTSADNRPPEGNGTIPAPPLRTTTIHPARSNVRTVKVRVKTINPPGTVSGPGNAPVLKMTDPDSDDD